MTLMQWRHGARNVGNGLGLLLLLAYTIFGSLTPRQEALAAGIANDERGGSSVAPLAAGVLISVLARPLSGAPPASGGGGGGGGGEWTAGTTDNGANLPTVKLDTTFNLAGQTGTVHRCDTVAEMNTAFTNCARGDVIVLESGTQFSRTTTVNVPAKTGTGWVYVVAGDVYDGLFPRDPGERVGPADATDMARVTITAINNAHFTFDHGASHPTHWRFVGIEMDSTVLQEQPFFLINGGTTTDANLCEWIGMDRCYLHGTVGSIAARSGVRLDGKNTFVLDSYMSGFHQSGAEAKCILMAQAGAGHKIVNNYLEAVSIQFMCGGESTVGTRTPSDVEFRYNYVKKLAAWAPTYTNDHKNLFEIKYGSRFLIEGNYFERSIQGGQNGMAINIQSSSQGGDGAQYKTVDVVFRYNRVRDYNWPFMVAGGRNGSTQTTERIVIRDNVFHGRIVSSQNIALFQGTTTGGGGLSDFVLINNVIDATNDSGGSLWTGNSNQTNLKIEGNITRGGDLLWADGVANTTTSFNTLWSGTKTLQDNFHFGTWQGSTANDNTLSTAGTWDGIWTNPAAEDFSIATGHAAKGTGIGGADPGPNITTYNARQQYTLTGQRPSAP